MKRMTYGLALLAALLTAACSQQQDGAASDEPVSLETTEQRLSYGIAYGLGERLKADGVPLDVAAFTLGLQHAFDGHPVLVALADYADEEAEPLDKGRRCWGVFSLPRLVRVAEVVEDACALVSVSFGATLSTLGQVIVFTTLNGFLFGV